MCSKKSVVVVQDAFLNSSKQEKAIYIVYAVYSIHASNEIPLDSQTNLSIKRTVDYLVPDAQNSLKTINHACIPILQFCFINLSHGETEHVCTSAISTPSKVKNSEGKLFIY